MYRIQVFIDKHRNTQKTQYFRGIVVEFILISFQIHLKLYTYIYPGISQIWSNFGKKIMSQTVFVYPDLSYKY